MTAFKCVFGLILPPENAGYDHVSLATNGTNTTHRPNGAVIWRS